MISETIRLCGQIFVEGTLDQLDMLAFQLIRRIVLLAQLQKLPEDPERRKIRQIASFLHVHMNERIRLDDIIRQNHFSRRSFFRYWKKEFSVSPIEYMQEKRLEAACSFLIYTEERISKISDQLGFVDQSYFCRFFKEKTGLSPNEYRQTAGNSTPSR
jgi:AraC-like DNA-binding protein